MTLDKHASKHKQGDERKKRSSLETEARVRTKMMSESTMVDRRWATASMVRSEARSSWRPAVSQVELACKQRPYHRVKNVGLGDGIQRAGGLIVQEDGGILQNSAASNQSVAVQDACKHRYSPCYRNPLFLATCSSQPRQSPTSQAPNGQLSTHHFPIPESLSPRSPTCVS